MTSVHATDAGAPAAAKGGSETASTSASELSAVAKRLFTAGPLLNRKLQHYRPFICPFERLVELVAPGSTVLDVGCGGGLWLGLLYESGRLGDGSGKEGGGVGFDSSAVAIQTAKAMHERLGSPAGLRFELLDVAAPWPEREGGFDVVSIVDVMHHVPPAHQRSVLENAVSRLRPGGRLIYKDMTHRSWRAHMNRLHDLTLARQWIRYCPASRVESWAAELGLRLGVREDHNRFWYGHELRVFDLPADRAVA